MANKIQTGSEQTYTSLTMADLACIKLEARAKCASAQRRIVYRVVKLTSKKRAEYIVCATPWAYRLQQQGRGIVIGRGE